MKKNEIHVGSTYRNRGKGKTLRKVLAIGDDHRPIRYFSMEHPPEEPGVLYEDSKGNKGQLYITSFASWAGSMVKKTPEFSVGDLAVFKKSFNVVKVISAGDFCYEVEQVTGKSAGKRLSADFSGLISIDEVLGQCRGSVDSPEWLEDALELIRSLKWPVWINMHAGGESDQKGCAVQVEGSGCWLAFFSESTEAERWIESNYLTGI